MTATLDATPAIEGYDELVAIGCGGLGDVYRAVQRSTGAAVAIKVLRPEGGMASADRSVAWHRCRRELTALVALAGHAHVITVLEVLDVDAGPALVMEYAPGGSVADLVAQRGAPLAVGEVAFVGAQAAEALVAAHARGIVHRDVKPHNLLIDAFGQVKLCDFGVAALARSVEFRTRTSAVSLRYASPEDLEDDGPVGPPADVYSLGATLLFLAHGVNLELRDRLAQWHPPVGSPPEMAALDELIAGCLRPDPAERPTAGALRLALDRVAATAPDRCRGLPVPDDAVGPGEGEGSTIVRPARHVRRVPRPMPSATAQRRAPWPVVVAIAAAVAAAGLAAVWWFGVAEPDVTCLAPSVEQADPSRNSVLGTLELVTGVPGTGLADESTEPTSGARRVRDGGCGSAVPEPSVVARPAGLVELTALEWPLGPVGECLVQEPGASALVTVGCDLPHDLERVATGTLAALDDEPPCPAGGLELSASTTRPSPDGWAAGDRTYQCWLGVPDHRVVGAQLPGDR